MTNINLPSRLFRVGSVEACRADGADGPRRFRLSFSSESPVERWFGVEVLGHGPGEVDLEWIGSGRAPLLVDHYARLDDQIGVVESVEIVDGKGFAVVRLGKSDKAKQIGERIEDGEISAVSVGYRIGELTLVGNEDGVRTYRATRWSPLEISVVSLPADSSVGIGRAADGDAIPVPVKGLRMEPEDQNPEPTAPAAPASRAAAAPRADDGRAMHRAAEDERGRIREITAMGRHANYRRQIPDLDAMVDKAIDEGTSVSDFGRRVLDRLGSAEAETLRAGAARVGLTDREVRSFSIIRAVRYLANPSDRRAAEAAAFEIEVSRAAAEKRGKEPAGLLIPADVLSRADFGGLMVRDQTVGTATAGGNLVATDLQPGSFISLIRKRSVLSRLGVRMLTGLDGNVDIPRQTSGGTTYWVGEKGEPTETAIAFDKVALTPHTLAAAIPISRRALLQTTPDIEALVRDDLVAIMALEMDRCGINGSADTDAPDGLLDFAINTADITTDGAPTWSEIVAVETAVAADDADVGNLAYAFNAKMRGHLKTEAKDAGSGLFVMEGTTVNGYRAEVSNQIVDGDVLFGNWSDFIVGMWSGLDLTVDRAAAAASGGLVLRAFQDLDFAVRHPESFCRGYAIP